MILSAEQIKELQELSQPLMMWLRDNAHPHTCITIDSEHTQIWEALAVLKNLQPLQNENQS